MKFVFYSTLLKLAGFQNPNEVRSQFYQSFQFYKSWFYVTKWESLTMIIDKQRKMMSGRIEYCIQCLLGKFLYSISICQEFLIKNPKSVSMFIEKFIKPKLNTFSCLNSQEKNGYITDHCVARRTPTWKLSSLIRENSGY